MQTELNDFDAAYEKFKHFIYLNLRVRTRDDGIFVAVAASQLPAGALSAVIQQFGAEAVHIDASNRMPPAIRAEDLATVIVHDRLRRGLKVAESNAQAPGQHATQMLLRTLAEAQSAQADASEVAAKAVDADSALALSNSENVATHLQDARSPKLRGVKLVDKDQVQIALKECAEDGGRQSRRKELLEQFNDRSTCIPLKAHQKHLRALDGLLVDFPHFYEVIASMRMDIQLQMASRDTLVFPPTLLVGPPGVGKTEFARQSAERLGCLFCPVSAGATTASFVLRGSHHTWSTAGAGVIAREMSRLKDRQALLLLLDEIDKLPALARDFPVEPVLLELLEPRQSMSFRDEYLGIGLNLTPFMTFIATANDLSRVSAPLQSRLRTFQVDLPTKEQMPAVARSLDRMIRSERPSFKRLFQPLNDEVIAALQSIPPRELRRVLMEGYGYALHRSSDRRRFIAVSVDDINKALKAGPSVPLSNVSPVLDEQSADVWAIVKFAKPQGGGNAPPCSSVH